MKKTTNYDKQPTIQISNDSSGCLVGWTAVAYAIQRCICSERKKVVVAECYPGVHLDEVLRGLSHAGFAQAVCTEELFKSPSSLLQMLEPCLGDDPVFGRIGAYALSDFFDMEKVANARNQIIQASDAVLVYGPGAAFIPEQWDHLIYCDVVRWEIQQRQRQGSVGNLGAQNCGDPPSRLYKRSYFVDWRVCDIEKHRLYGLFSFYIDTNREQYPVMIAGRDYRNALWEVTRRPFRLVPFFDPGPWGGEWMRTRFGLPDGPPNFAWCFDCVPEENSLRFGFGDEVVEVPAINLVHEFPEGLLGSHVLEQFGAEFPIRFVACPRF